ncbi:hypothetical protein LTR66_017853, partial [Elasticomyces elasticus]
MLQAAIQGGRVLSAEEITFSMKVRSMYDRGDEGAADWVNGQDTPHLPQQEEDRGTPDMQQSKLQVGERQTVEGNAISRCASAASMREGRIVREPYELAGGIEDWENINGQEVDRYGFILPRKAPSRGYQNSPVPSESQRIPRVSTSLQVASESPRGKRALHRKPSDTRSTRSTITPRRTSDAGTGPPASLYSYQSANSNGFASNPFKSRDRRCMDEASDMLTLPPGLADVAEQEDGGRTANLMKQREWAREEKWRNMARLVHKGHRGEGMYFTFDTQDPKVVARTWKGIPDRWRATAWHAFLTDSAARRGGHASDEQLIDVFHQLQERSSADDVQIDVDVPRTINMHIMFRRRYRGGQRLLFRVLHAISLHCPEPGPPVESLQMVNSIPSQSEACFDYVVITTKNVPDCPPTIADLIEPAIIPGKTVIVLIQNGLNIEKPFLEKYPTNICLSGVSLIGSHETAPAFIEHEDPDRLTIGTFANPHAHQEEGDASAHRFIKMYSAAGKTDCTFTSDVPFHRWQKLVYNACFNPVCAITGLDTGRIRLAEDTVATLLRPAMQEVVAAAKAVGVVLPLRIEDRMINIDPVTMYLRPSMLEDVQK